MAQNETKLEEIIKQMDQSWISFRCDPAEGQTNFNGFLFGWKPEVDEIHDKDMAFMVVNPPPSSASTIQIEYEQVKTNTSFVVQIYNKIPSDHFGLSPTLIPEYWDNMENCFYYWLQDVLLALGSKVQIGSGSINITRTKQASNDQFFSIECKFNLDYFRYCFDLDGNN
jgi:hypothetical protein